MRRSLRTGVLIGGLAVAAAAGPGRAGIQTLPDRVEEGETAAILITDDQENPVVGVEVQATYRPGSEVSRTESLGVTAVDGMVSWTPDGAGLVRLSTTGEGSPGFSADLSVRYRRVPFLGLVILIAAGCILYGMVIVGFRHLSGPPIPLPPDT